MIQPSPPPHPPYPPPPYPPIMLIHVILRLTSIIFWHDFGKKRNEVCIDKVHLIFTWRLGYLDYNCKMVYCQLSYSGRLRYKCMYTSIVLKRTACLTKSPNLVLIKPTLNKIPLNRFWPSCDNYCFYLWFVLDGDKKMAFLLH